MPSASIYIEGAVKLSSLNPDRCDMTSGALALSGILDISEAGTKYTNGLILTNTATAPVEKASTLGDLTGAGLGNTSSGLTALMDTTEVWFTDDGGKDIGILPSDSQRLTHTIGGVVPPGERGHLVTSTVGGVQTNLMREDPTFTDVLGQGQPLNATLRIIANIQASGWTDGRGYVLTAPFAFPIDVCRGCLLGPEADLGESCPVGQSLLPVEDVSPCVPRGQDQHLFVCVSDVGP